MRKNRLISLLMAVLLFASVFAMPVTAEAEITKIQTNFVQPKDLNKAKLWKANSKRGKVETVRYQSHYYNGKTQGGGFKKYMTVYTPYGYKKSKQYDVLILLPGMNMSENCFLNKAHNFGSKTSGVYLKNLFDNAIEDGKMKPMIVVNVNYFGSTVLGGQPVMELDANQVARELRNDILPYIVKHYGTYAEGTSKKELRAARDHFGVFGFSYTSTMIVRTVMPEDMDIFAWFGASSVFYCDLKESYKTVNKKIDQYPIRYFYCGCGSRDNAHDQTVERYKYFISKVDGLKKGYNTRLVVLSKAGHSTKTYDTAIYNCATNFFQNTDPPAPSVTMKISLAVPQDELVPEEEEAAILQDEEAAEESSSEAAAEEGVKRGASAVPERTEEITEAGKLRLDTGHADAGYVYAMAEESSSDYKLKITNGVQTNWYNINRNGEWELIPVPFGDGDYEFVLYEKSSDDKEYQEAGRTVLEIMLNWDALADLQQIPESLITDPEMIPKIQDRNSVFGKDVSEEEQPGDVESLLGVIFGEEAEESGKKIAEKIKGNEMLWGWITKSLSDLSDMASNAQSKLREQQWLQYIVSKKGLVRQYWEEAKHFLCDHYRENVDSVFSFNWLK